MEHKDKFITLVFCTEDAEGKEVARDAALSTFCRAWSLDHEILRLDLIEKALDENDIDKAKSYFGAVDVSQFLGDL